MCRNVCNTINICLIFLQSSVSLSLDSSFQKELFRYAINGVFKVFATSESLSFMFC